eukprot:g54744.t1
MKRTASRSLSPGVEDFVGGWTVTEYDVGMLDHHMMATSCGTVANQRGPSSTSLRTFTNLNLDSSLRREVLRAMMESTMIL